MPLLPVEKASRWWLLSKLPLFILVVSMLVPYYWMAIGAFKTVPELVQQPPTFVVEKPTTQNFYDPGFVEGEVHPDHWAGIFQHESEGYGFVYYYLNSLGEIGRASCRERV